MTPSQRRRRPAAWSVLALVLGGSLLAGGLAAPPGSASATHAAPVAEPGGTGGWTPAPATAPRAAGADVRVEPRRAYAFQVDADGAASALARADAGGVLVLPDPEGRRTAFVLEETSVLSPALAARHPEIRTYAGHAVADPRRTVRVDLTPTGLHASVRSLGDGGSWYVDPALDARGVERHLSYRPSALPGGADVFVERGPSGVDEAAEVTGGVPQAAYGSRVVRRTYRLALLNDPAYARRFGARNVLAEKATLLNRVNQIYDDDLGITMRLVDKTPRLNLATTRKAYGADGPCGRRACFQRGVLAACSSELLAANQSAVDRILGSAAYDVGHVVLGVSGGGLAGVGVVGRKGVKAQGCTGLEDPVGDAFYVDYVAHEMGHQFGAEHTFDGVRGFCAGNRAPSSAVEPGSGSSVMGYAGICGDDDLQEHSDPYFSQRSIEQVTSYVSSTTARGGRTAVSENRVPSVTAPADRMLPVLTPFTLTAQGADRDDPSGDGLTYLWEQDDDGGSVGAQLSADPRPDGPLFRVFGDDTRDDDDGLASRTFPDLAQVLAGATNAEDGTCAAFANQPARRLDCLSELLPTTAWVDPLDPFSFRVTVRDGERPGGTAFDDVELTLDPRAGPFAVTSQDAGGIRPGGGAGTVTWDVNGTARETLAPEVRVVLSTDGGETFDQVLVESTPNDGDVPVSWPDVDTEEARVRVEAVGNYFFDVNDVAFAIDADLPVEEPAPGVRP